MLKMFIRILNAVLCHHMYVGMFVIYRLISIPHLYVVQCHSTNSDLDCSDFTARAVEPARVVECFVRECAAASAGPNRGRAHVDRVPFQKQVGWGTRLSTRGLAL